MIIKKFQADTETEAIIKAKEDMGSSAIVMNIKTIKPRGIMVLFKKPVIEITAALDESQAEEVKKESLIQVLEATKAEKEKKSEKAAGQISNNPLNQIYEEKHSRNIGKSTGEIEEKLASLQALLEEKIYREEKENARKVNEQKEAATEAEIYAKMIYNKLLNHEVDEKYVNQLVDEVDRNLQRDSGLDYVLSTVYQKMILKLGESKPIQLTNIKPKVVFFIGPTGVGKTTTIAKLASKFALDQKSKIVMLTADTYRIAATEQLHTYANILSVPFKVIYTPEEIQKAVDEYKDYDLILVDTAGHSHQNEEQLSDIKKFLDSIDDDEQKEVFLVLSATTKYSDLKRIVDSYKGLEGFKLIFTKLDETTCLGNILNIKIYTDADLSYLTCGQNVPDDIEKLDAQRIVKQLLGGK